jgi:hypothetical protein
MLYREILLVGEKKISSLRKFMGDIYRFGVAESKYGNQNAPLPVLRGKGINSKTKFLLKE